MHLSRTGKNAMSLVLQHAHPGVIIKQKLVALGVTQTAAAQAMRVSLKSLCAVVNGRAGLSAPMAIRLAIVVGGSAEEWLALQVRYEVALVRIKMRNIFSKLEPLERTAQC
jgi:addiction module HigA family antidote